MCVRLGQLGERGRAGLVQEGNGARRLGWACAQAREEGGVGPARGRSGGGLGPKGERRGRISYFCLRQKRGIQTDLNGIQMRFEIESRGTREGSPIPDKIIKGNPRNLSEIRLGFGRDLRWISRTDLERNLKGAQKDLGEIVATELCTPNSE